MVSGYFFLFYSKIMNLKVEHDIEDHKFKVQIGPETLVLEYQYLSSQIIDFTYTYVPWKYRNQGLGSYLVAQSLQRIKEEGIRVKASCPFVSNYLKEHPEYEELMIY